MSKLRVNQIISVLPRLNAQGNPGFQVVRQPLAPTEEHLVLFAGDPQDTVKRFLLAQAAVSALQHRMPARLVTPYPTTHSNILLYMRACDTLLVTSQQEGSSNVVKEALACGLPVVSVAVGDIPQRIGNVRGCELCEEATPETLATALERVLVRRQRINGLETIRDLDENHLTQRLIAIYQGIAPDAHGPRNDEPQDATSRS